jgi:hypothetical protein
MNWRTAQTSADNLLRTRCRVQLKSRLELPRVATGNITREVEKRATAFQRRKIQAFFEAECAIASAASAGAGPLSPGSFTLQR